MAANPLVTLASQTFAQIKTAGRKSIASTDFDNLVSDITGVNNSLTTLINYSNSVVSFGADPSGVSDSTAAFRLAIASGRSVYVPTGTYMITDTLVLNSGQIMRGDGRTQSIIRVNSATFNMSAAQVIRLGISEPGASLFDIGITFVQADCARSALIQYPTAINAQSSSRFQIQRVRICGGWIGLDATNNGAGGSFLNDFECSSFSQGVVCDGSYDFFHIGTVEFWPYGLSAAMIGVYLDGNTTGMEIGRVDGFSCVRYTTFQTQIHFNSNAGTNGIAYNFGIMDLDGDHANLNVDSGVIQIGQFYSTKSGIPTDIPVNIKGGNVNISSFYYVGATQSIPIQVSNGVFSINGGNISANRANIPAVSATGGLTSINNVKIYTASGSWSNPVMQQTGGVLQVSNSSFMNSGTTAGIAYTVDNALNSFVGNQMNGWAAIFPAGCYLGNYNISNSVSSNSYSFRNKIINGAFRFDQRLEGTAAQYATGYGPDRWFTTFTQSAKTQISQATVTNSAFPQFNYVGAINNPNYYTATASDQFCFGQNIEGMNIVDLNWGTSSAKPITVSFYALSLVSGPFAVSIRNSAKNMSYVAYVTQPSNTWSYFTLTIPGPTTGTWLTTSGSIGLTLSFDLGSGANFQTASTYTWNSGSSVNYTSFSGNSNFVGTQNAVMYISGVQLETGSIATGYEMRPLDIEFARCLRYFEKSFPAGTAPAQNAGGVGSSSFTQAVAASTAQNGNSIYMKVPKMATPSVTLFNPSAANAQMRNNTASADCSSTSVNGTLSDKVFGINFTSAASTSQGNGNSIHWTASAEL